MVQTGRFCPNCGSPVNPGAAFCASCGQTIRPAGTAPQPTAFQPPPPASVAPQYSSPPPPYMPPPAGGNRAASAASILFWTTWAMLAILSGIMLADGFSFLRAVGFMLVLAFPLLTRKSLFRRMKTSLASWAGVLVAFILVVSLFPSGPGKSNSSGAIKTGEAVVAASSTIPASGGTLAVNKPSDPLNGLVLTVPAGSYSSSLKFDISYAPVTSQSFGADFNPVTPLISVENGGKYSAQLMEIKVPVAVPEDSFAMGFIYDDATGKLEGMPLIARDATSITVATRHFSHFLVSMIKKAELEKDINTGFVPGYDDWEFTNYGSAVAPGGHCAGQSMTAMWYYVTQPDGADATLYGRYDNNGQNPKTPGLWQDDSLGYRFASVIQADQWNDAASDFWRKLSAVDAATTRNLFAYAMLITKEPQMVVIWSKAGGGHAMIVYAATSGLLHIADPNYPGNIDRRIQYDGGAFKPYNSGANAADIAAGNGKAYESIEYWAKSAIVDYPHIAARWAEVKAGTIGSGSFPQYSLVYMDADGQYQELKDGLILDSPKIRIRAGIAGKYEGVNVYRDGVELRWDVDGAFDLKTGSNRLGVYVTQTMPDGKYKYVDFRYVTVSNGGMMLNPPVQEGEPGKPLTFSVSLSNPLPAGYKIEWWADGALKKSGADLSFSVSFAAAGTHDIAVKMVDASGKTVMEDTGTAVIKGGTTTATATSTATSAGQLALLRSALEVNMEFRWTCGLTEWNAAGTRSTQEGYYGGASGPKLVWDGTSFSGGFSESSTYEDNSVTIRGTVSADGKTLLSVTITQHTVSRTSQPERLSTYDMTLVLKNIPLAPYSDSGAIGGSIKGSAVKNYLTSFRVSRVDTWNGTQDYKLSGSESGIRWSESGFYEPFISVSFQS